MSLKIKIAEQMKQALKAHRAVELGTLRMLNSAILYKEKARDKAADALSDEEVLDVIISETKKRKEAIMEFEKGQRADLADKEKQELAILNQYLPAQLSEQELAVLVNQALVTSGAKTIKEMGKVMQLLAPQLKGRADGAKVAQLVRAKLGV